MDSSSSLTANLLLSMTNPPLAFKSVEIVSSVISIPSPAVKLDAGVAHTGRSLSIVKT